MAARELLISELQTAPWGSAIYFVRKNKFDVLLKQIKYCIEQKNKLIGYF